MRHGDRAALGMVRVETNAVRGDHAARIGPADHKVLTAEIAVLFGNVAGVLPVGHINIVVRQKLGNGKTHDRSGRRR